MRLHIKTTPNNRLIWFNYQPKITGVIQKWIGVNNQLHGDPALYSFSWLNGGIVEKEGLDFPDGANFFISFHCDLLLKKVMRSILKDPEICFAMKVSDIYIEKDPDLTNRNHFSCASPVFIQRHNENKVIHYTYEDKNAGLFLKELLLRKMDLAGLAKDDSLNISFDLSSPYKKTKVVYYNEIGNKTNLCPVFIDAKAETKLFAWNVGIGNSTGIGFGAIY
jgi:CRISPR-associated endoribonuclease Cas6